MLIGAEARNLIHERLGHAFAHTSTQDIDISLAIADWPSFDHVTEGLRPLNDSGIAFDVAGYHVDIYPFGAIESSAGTLTPPWRPADPIDVFAMSAAYRASEALALGGEPLLRIPTIPGYVALKIKAWIDRSVPARGIHKDGADLGLALFWYENDPQVRERLWIHEAATLLQHAYDLGVASARLLGNDVRSLLGEPEAARLSSLWTAESRALLGANLVPRDFRAALRLGDSTQIALRLAALADGLAGR